VFSDEFINAYQHYRFERDVWPDEGRPTAYEFKTTYQC
jgi:glutamine synthetase